jgi:hypothetical protein
MTNQILPIFLILSILTCRVDTIANEAQSEEIQLVEAIQKKTSPFEIPGWEDKMALWLADLAIRTRHEPRKKLESLSSQIKKLESAGQGGSEESKKLHRQAYEAEERYILAQTAGIELGRQLMRLGEVNDRRVVRLVAPLLSESTATFFGGDYLVSAPQERAAGTLDTLQFKGVISAPDYDRDVEKWRTWWRANHKRFGPVVPAFDALEGRKTNDAKNSK